MQTFTIDSAEKPHEIYLTEPGDYRVEITCPGAEVEIKGGWLLEGSTQAVVNLAIAHLAPHTKSKTLLRGVARDMARVVLNGTIYIAPEGQDTNAFLTENVLLLSPRARAEAIPNLEILANEVHCSHAATVSNIPEEHLFYLMSRGLNKTQAEDLIIQGFLAQTHQNTLE